MNAEKWENIPTYLELFRALQEYLNNIFQKNEAFNSTYVKQFLNNITLADTLFMILSALVVTYIRQTMTEKIFKPLGHHYALTHSDQLKMPESAWKFLYNFTAVCVNGYILILSGDYKFFQSPSSVWNGWSLNQPIPIKIYLFYIVQMGFYLHSLYAVLFMDTWRKDHLAMITHHSCTIVVIYLSFVVRGHNVGCLTILLHDICDIFLEFSKLNVYFKIQNGKHIKMHDLLANVSFLCFTVVWCVARLYWYPLRVLYAVATDIHGLQSVLPPFSLLANCLMWILQILNVYWSFFIFQTLYKVATGQVIDDNREYDDDKKLNQKEPNEKKIS